MFCDGCGAAVQPGQAFCGKCGKQILGPIAVMQNRPGRVQGHLQLLGILWLAISAFNTIGGVVLYILANTLFTHLHEMGAPEAPTAFLRPLLSVLGIFVLRLSRGMGIDAARALGACARPGARIHFVIQHSIGHGRRNLHTLGATASAVARGV